MIPEPSHCCERLAECIARRCDEHPEPGRCADDVIGYSEKFDEYGLWIHDGPDGMANSWIGIDHCPFCGRTLPPSRREEWFDRLDARGLDPETAPDELNRHGWWIAAATDCPPFVPAASA